MITAVGASDLRRTLYETWETMAPGWDERREWLRELSRPVAEHLVSRLAPQPGETILELAAGLGDAGFEAARRCPDCHVVVTDFSPSMVDAARRRAEELGIENAEFRVMDGERLERADASVDGVLCRWGYMLMPDPAAALVETRRVLREGGRLAFSVWAGPERNPFAARPARVLVERGHLPPPAPGAPGIFSMASRERIDDLLRGAGFAEWEVEEVPVTWSFASFDEYWRYLIEFVGAIGMAIRALPDDARDSVREALEESVADLRANGGYTMPSVCLDVLAR
ncbi:MAG: methyltransferase domain-containing protein [Thermoleophilia bacterium]|nr:methyltransferase domain-containing protein [Thermoleophilia bacterium]